VCSSDLSLPEAQAQCAADILDFVESADGKREYLQDLRTLFIRKSLEKGFRVKGEAHILSITIGNEQKSLALARRLFEKGFFVFPARYPTVPLGQAIIRVSLSSLIEEEDVIRLIKEISACGI
jgi:8-amino-7-oxononanoate synthase